MNTVLELNWEASVAEAREQTHPCVDDMLRIAVADELAKLRSENDALLALARRVHAECGPFRQANGTWHCQSCTQKDLNHPAHIVHTEDCLWLAAEAVVGKAEATP